VIDQ
jgi:large subunit ribosomal protein L2